MLSGLLTLLFLRYESLENTQPITSMCPWFSMCNPEAVYNAEVKILLWNKATFE